MEPSTVRKRGWEPRRRTVVIPIVVLAVGSALVLVLASRDAPQHHGEQVRALLLARGESDAEYLSADGFDTGIDNTCESRSPEEWASFVKIGASINVGGNLTRQMVYVASYVDVGCPDQRTNLEHAARLLQVSIPSPP